MDEPPGLLPGDKYIPLAVYPEGWSGASNKADISASTVALYSILGVFFGALLSRRFHSF
jgi:hypothetical protein